MLKKRLTCSLRVNTGGSVAPSNQEGDLALEKRSGPVHGGGSFSGAAPNVCGGIPENPSSTPPSITTTYPPSSIVLGSTIGNPEMPLGYLNQMYERVGAAEMQISS